MAIAKPVCKTCLKFTEHCKCGESMGVMGHMTQDELDDLRNALKPRNIKEVKALVNKYNSITITDIRRELYQSNADTFESQYIANKLTGFGSTDSCTLCLALRNSFAHHYTSCIHTNYVLLGEVGCSSINGKSRATYMAIDEASDPSELLQAFKDRAEYLHTLINSYNEDN